MLSFCCIKDSFFLSFSSMHRVHQGRLSNPCLSSPPRRPNGPATCSRMQPPWTTARAWKTSLAHSTIWNRTLSAWNTRWAHKTTRPEHAKICSSATQSSLMVSRVNSGARRTFIYLSADLLGLRLIRTYITCCRRAFFVDKHLCFRPADNVLKNKERMLSTAFGFFLWRHVRQCFWMCSVVSRWILYWSKPRLLWGFLQSVL